MSQREPALTPLYGTGTDTESIELHRGPIEFERNTGSSLRAEGVVYVDLLPSPALRVGLGTDEPSASEFFLAALLVDDEPLNATVVDVGVEGQVQFGSPAPSEFSDFSTRIAGRFQLAPATHATPNIRSCVFHLINAHKWLDRVELDANGWRTAISGSTEVDRQLDASGGYAINRVAEVRRTDDDVFTSADVNEQFASLQYFLTLVRGTWCAPVLPVGFDAQGQRVWEDWSSLRRRVSPWRSPITWYNPMIQGGLNKLYKSFVDRWLDPYDRRILQLFTEYYVGASTSDTVNTRLTLAQSGLELMAWVVLVEDTRQLTAKQWRNTSQHPADSKLRRLLDWAHIPASIPSRLQELTAAASDACWQDGPQAITRLRNSVVHPRRAKPAGRHRPWSDAWLLSTWYLDLIVLRWLGYRGEYSSRLDLPLEVGKLATVPWGGGP